MTAIMALAYGFLASFVLSSVRRNHRMKRRHSPALLRLGYLLVGVSAGTSAILVYMAATGMELA